jgi:hypothetical protein
MKYAINKQGILLLITGTSILFSLTGLARSLPLLSQNPSPSDARTPEGSAAQIDPILVNTPIMSEQHQQNHLQYPLSPNDPAAQLDPSLMNVPPMPEPQVNEAPISGLTESPGTAVGHDLKTGSTQVGQPKSARSSHPSTEVSPPYTGADSEIHLDFPDHTDSQ